jgi:hypothetical protein
MSLLLAVLLSQAPKVIESTVPCKTVADCWLDAEGTPIARPKKFKGKKLPQGDCHQRLVWLRYQLSCEPEKHVCEASYRGDKC